jgi:rubrerythrin
MLHHYEHVAQAAKAPEIRYLVLMILDEERRHHRLLAEMANAIAWGMSEDSPVATIPDVTYKDAGNVALAEETRNLLRAEHNDRTELKRLRKQLRPFKEITLWELIVDLMLLDTEKHIQILSAIGKFCESG